MPKLIDGKSLAKSIRAEVERGIAQLDKTPLLVAVAVGEDEASLAYTRSQGRTAARLGIGHRVDELPGDATLEAVREHLAGLAADGDVTGIMVQMPLPKHLNEAEVRAAIPLAKDVEAVTDESAGRLMQGTHAVAPPTAMAAFKCLEAGAPEGVTGLDVAVLGRSQIVGRPLAMLLLNANATPTVCHTRTRDLDEKLRRADAVIVAAGRPGLVNGDMIREGAIVVDVGTNYAEDGSVSGDVDFASAAEKAGAITPVPGGVGPVTVAVLMSNVLELARRER